MRIVVAVVAFAAAVAVVVVAAVAASIRSVEPATEPVLVVEQGAVLVAAGVSTRPEVPVVAVLVAALVVAVAVAVPTPVAAADTLLGVAAAVAAGDRG